MARPIWTGTLSFGLLNVPVSLMTGEQRVDLHFRMLDARDNKPIRYERVNAETGAEVPWKEIVKAFEYDKGNYVVLEPDDIKSASADRRESIDVEAFVDYDAIGPEYFEKPYFLVPGKKAEKGYVLLRETMRKTKRVGIGRVVVRTREYLCAVMPRDDALMLILLRYPQELVDADSYKFPAADAKKYRVSAAELKMAEQLVASMSGKWNPADYTDEFRERLTKVIAKRMKSKGVVKQPDIDDNVPENAATNVVDFVSLLKKSLQSNQRTPAKKHTASAEKSKIKRSAASSAKKQKPKRKRA